MEDKRLCVRWWDSQPWCQHGVWGAQPDSSVHLRRKRHCATAPVPSMWQHGGLLQELWHPLVGCLRCCQRPHYLRQCQLPHKGAHAWGCWWFPLWAAANLAKKLLQLCGWCDCLAEGRSGKEGGILNMFEPFYMLKGSCCLIVLFIFASNMKVGQFGWSDFDIIAFEESSGETLIVEEAVPRNYSSFLEQLRIKIHNCFMPRGDTSVPHSFTYKRRSDLSSKEVGQLTGTNREGHARDVFGICKSRMSDPARDSFKPVLVLPFAFMDWVGTYDSIPIMPRKVVSPERAKALERLAVILEGNPYHNAKGQQHFVNWPLARTGRMRWRISRSSCKIQRLSLLYCQLMGVKSSLICQRCAAQCWQSLDDWWPLDDYPCLCSSKRTQTLCHVSLSLA